LSSDGFRDRNGMVRWLRFVFGALSVRISRQAAVVDSISIELVTVSWRVWCS
jgi:hypothetical protein